MTGAFRSGCWPDGFTLRFDPAPLLAVGRDSYERLYDWPIQGPGQFAGVLGVDRTSIYRWLRDGIAWYRAIEVCDRLKIDPDRLWPGFSDALDTRDEIRRDLDAARHRAQRRANRHRWEAA